MKKRALAFIYIYTSLNGLMSSIFDPIIITGSFIEPISYTSSRLHLLYPSTAIHLIS